MGLAGCNHPEEGRKGKSMVPNKDKERVLRMSRLLANTALTQHKSVPAEEQNALVVGVPCGPAHY